MTKAVGRAWVVLFGASLVTLLLTALAHRLTRVSITDVTLTGGMVQHVTFPYSAPASVDRPLAFEFHVRAGVLSQRSYLIVPDDHLVSISVNGENESLASVDQKSLDDFRDGFTFPLGQHFKSGDNLVVVRVTNRGGPGGLDVRPDPKDSRNRIEIVTAALACLTILGLGLSRVGLAWPIVVVVVSLVALRVAYVLVTPYTVRTHDVGGHLEYVQYVLVHHAAPRPSEGYSFFHPPLYYGISAIVWKALEAIGVGNDDILVALQLESMVFSLGFAAFGFATVRLWTQRLPAATLGRGLLGRDGVEALAIALLLGWPSAVMHSARIGNDDLAYLFIAAGGYFMSRWWLEERHIDAHVAALCGALGVVTKTNSLLVFVALAVLLVARLVIRRREGRTIRVGRVVELACPTLALLGVSTAIAFGKTIAERLAGHGGNLLVANASRNPVGLNVGNHAKNFLWIDLPMFLREPFTSPWDDAKGRQFFWHFFLKTSLFGEWTFDHRWAGGLAIALTASLLFLMAYGAIGTALRGLSAWIDELPLLLLLGGLVASSVALRMMLPGVSSGDFRYVLPVLVPCAWLYVRSALGFRERGWTKTAFVGAVMGWLFVGLSALFLGGLVAAAV